MEIKNLIGLEKPLKKLYKRILGKLNLSPVELRKLKKKLQLETIATGPFQKEEKMCPNTRALSIKLNTEQFGDNKVIRKYFNQNGITNIELWLFYLLFGLPAKFSKSFAEKSLATFKAVVVEKEERKRDPSNWLVLSLWHAQEYFETLCILREKHNENEIQSSKELNITHRALWTSLIAEVRKLFDNSRYPNYSLRKIPFFQKQPHKDIVDSIYGNRIISRIINTGNTFTLHLGEDEAEILPVSEICDSNLGDLLKKLEEPIELFNKKRYSEKD